MDMRRLVVPLAALLIVAGAGAAYAADSDGDGMPDRWERSHGLSPNKPNAGGDPDRDHLKNIDEYLHHGDPHNDDTDNDGISDGNEVHKWGTRVDQADAVVGLVSADTVCSRDGDCGQAPLGGARLILREDDGTELSTYSNEDGTFSFRAPSGHYTLTPRDVPGFATPAPITFNHRSGSEVIKYIYGQETGLGLVGQVTQSPTCPGPQRPGDDCTDPLEGAPLRVEDSTGAVVGRTTSDAGGRYYFDLGAGSYTLVAENLGQSNLPAPPGPVDFTIRSNDPGPVSIALDYDTGIR
ncbi:MAG: hypothetical protein QOG54_2620 [Actinomycetota bacterium]|nr:hypothetical protein [Actinomycetota bacterium]